MKNDPMLIAAARELRDRWLEQVNREGLPLEVRGKYDVAREIQGTQERAKPATLLPAA